MKTFNHFEKAFEATVKATCGADHLTKPEAEACWLAATNIDRLTLSLVEDARVLASKASQFANDLAAGFMHATPPTSASIIAEIARAKVELETRVSAFNTLVRICYGKDFLRQMNDDLKVRYAADAQVPA